MYRYLEYALLAGLFTYGQAMLRTNRARQESVARNQEGMTEDLSKGSRLEGTSAPFLAPKFFDEFSEGESTYDEAFFHQSPGFDRVGYDEEHPPQAVDPQVFAETPSAGSKEAWQTYWPGSAKVQTNRIGPKPSWHQSNIGYDEPYLVAESNGDGTDGTGFKAARWFDSSVLKYNGMGQPQLPAKGTGARLSEAEAMDNPWIQRAVNTTLLCREAGCTAESKLTVFDTKVEEVERCRLNIHVHPTDYDNQWSQEFVKRWTVNGYMATAKCTPNAMGCNASAWRPLIPCLQDLNVDQVLLADATGTLTIRGSINKLVDECPYHGFLLNGVATVTCMARPKMKGSFLAAPRAQYGGAIESARTGYFDSGYSDANSLQGAANGINASGVNGGIYAGANGIYGAYGPYGIYGAGAYGNGAGTRPFGPFGYLYDVLGYGNGINGAYWQGGLNSSTIQRMLQDRLDPGMSFLAATELRCCAPGCAAQGILEVDPVILRAGAQCLMNFSVVQTDFDEAVGNDIERIEFISVSGLGNISRNFKPGRNPCTEMYSTGSTIPGHDRVINVLENQNVTQQLLAPPFGQLIINSKITEQVDDCAFQDALFHAMAVVQCHLPLRQVQTSANTSSNTTVPSTSSERTNSSNISAK